MIEQNLLKVNAPAKGVTLTGFTRTTTCKTVILCFVAEALDGGGAL